MSISLFAQGKNLILKTVKYSKETKTGLFYCLDETEIDKPAYGCSGDMKGRDLFHPSVFFLLSTSKLCDESTFENVRD